MTKFNLWLIAFLSLLSLNASPCALAQQAGPLQPSDTSSVRLTLTSFLAACNDFNEALQQVEVGSNARFLLPKVEKILDCLDLSGLPQEMRDRVGLEAAVYLKEVLDRVELPTDFMDDLPSANPNTEAIWKIPGTRLAIAKVNSGDKIGEYLFTSDTVRQANKYYRIAKPLAYRTSGPPVSEGLRDRFADLTNQMPEFHANTSSPRGTLTLFLNSAREINSIIQSGEYVDRSDPKYLPLTLRLVGCLDLSDLPEYSRDYYATEAAVCIKEVLDRTLLPTAEEIPGAEDIRGANGIPLTRWQIPNTRLTLIRIEEGSRRGEYLFSSESVRQARSYYDKVKRQPYRSTNFATEGLYDWYMSAPASPMVDRWVRSLPAGLRTRVQSLAVWQWLGLGLLVLISFLVMWLVYRFGRIGRGRAKNQWQNWAMLLFPILGVMVPVVFMHLASEYLTLRGKALYVTDFCGNVVFLLAVVIVILGLSTKISDSIIALPSIKEKGLDATLTRIVCRLGGLVVATVVFLEGGQYLGFPLTTLLASAGIGGLAIALSAQGMIKGLFGTIAILLDKPFRVGERIVVNGHDGFVEEIGLRSTRIRTISSNHQIAIPNDQMADTEIENVGRRQHIRKNVSINIPIDSPRRNVEKAIELIRDALKDHEGMESDFPPRVFFDEFQEDSFRIQVTYWYHPPDHWAFMEFSEKLNLQILKALDENEIQLSLPKRHSFWKEDRRQGPLDIRITNNESSLGEKK